MSKGRLTARPHHPSRILSASARKKLRGLAALLASGPAVRTALLDIDGLKGPFG